MSLEYYVSFSDANQSIGFCGRDIIPELIEKVEEKLSEYEQFIMIPEEGKKYDISQRDVPYVGKMNVFKTNNEEVAEIFREAMMLTLAFDYQGTNIFVSPVNSNKI